MAMMMVGEVDGSREVRVWCGVVWHVICARDGGNQQQPRRRSL